MFSTLSLAVTVLAVQPAAADFLVYSGYSNSALDDVRTNINIFVNDAPDCGTAVNSVQMTNQFYNDASNGGIACDGCDASKSPADWDVERFEVNDDTGSVLVGPDGNVHITLYKDDANGGWGLYDTDMNSLGACTKPDPVQLLNCPDVFAADSSAGIFDCVSDSISAKPS